MQRMTMSDLHTDFAHLTALFDQVLIICQSLYFENE